MTEIQIEQPDEQNPDRGVLHRSFAADITPGDGRTVDVRIVPYGERITHNDGLGGLPVGMPYTEEWAPGVFGHQMKAAHRVLANVEHEQGIGGIVGHGTALLEDSDGFYGSFKFHDTADGNKALMLVREGILEGVSVEAIPQKTIKTKDGIIQRVKAHLRAIAFAREPAYSKAVVLAVREQASIPDDLQPVDMDPDLVARCQALGLELPERYRAHLAEPDTPEQGTPDGDTRQPDEN